MGRLERGPSLKQLEERQARAQHEARLAAFAARLRRTRHRTGIPNEPVPEMESQSMSIADRLDRAKARLKQGANSHD
tara:strand:- start:3172 stop:3402 length:231 start_codon:yes stop_codon:yes gene_type:complete